MNKQNNIFKKIAVGTALLALIGGGIYYANRPKVGIINFSQVQRKAKVYLDALEQQQKYDAKVQELITKDKDFIQLEADGQKLAEQQKTMPVAEFERKSAALQARALKINEKYRGPLERNALASQLALKSLEKDIAQAIEATSKRTGAKVLLPINTILYAAETVDYTDVFVEELDKRVQTVTYPNPETLK